MPHVSSCPGVNELERLMLGQVSDQEAEALEAHLSQCERCMARLPRLDAKDSLVERLRGGQAIAAEFGQSHVVENLIRRLRDLQPPEAGPAAEVPTPLGGEEGQTPTLQVGAEGYDFLGPPQEPGDLGQLGPYRVLKVLGAGGMGVVFQAEDPLLRRLVALKVMRTTLPAGAAGRERFRREAQSAALLHHSNIVPIFGVGQERGVHFYAMQFIHGKGLDSVLQELRRQRGAKAAAAAGDQPPLPGELEPPADLSASLAEGLRSGQLQERMVRGRSVEAGQEGPSFPDHLSTSDRDSQRSALTGQGEGEYFRGVARIGLQVAEALTYAHRQGILHRDIKPSNLLLDAQGTVWISDFGLAKAEGGDELTQSGDVVGTLRYIAPERFEGQSGPRSDLYSLGATLYQLLTLRPPFEDTDRARLIERVTRGEPPRPRQIDGRIPRDLETIVLKAMAKKPADRYPSAEALAEDLGRFLSDRPIQARRAGLRERTWRWCRRNPVVAGLLTIAVVLATVMTVLALLLWDKQQQTEAARKQADQQRQVAAERRLVAEANFQQACVLLTDDPLHDQLDWLIRQGPRKRQQAVEALEKAQALYKGFLKEPGPDPAERLLTARVYRLLADVQEKLQHEVEAAQSYRKAIDLLQALVIEFPREAGFRSLLAFCHSRVAWLTRGTARLEEIEAAQGHAISLLQGLRSEFPDVPWYTRELGHQWHWLGGVRRVNGRFQQAEEAYRQALALRQQLFEQLPEVGEHKDWLAQSHSQLAWLLITRTDRQPRHATEALEHARKAVEFQPDFHDWWHTLGVAHCRVGNWKEALAAIEKSRQLENKPGPPGSFDRFFEAMAYSRLGDREKARRCYDEGVQWMEKHFPDHADLRRFRAEAAEMLGIQNPK